MLSGNHPPTSLRSLLASFRLGFTQPSFLTFCALLRGFLAHVGEHAVCGMLTGSDLVQRWHHARAHRFLSHRRWCVDRVGLQLAALLVSRLMGANRWVESESWPLPDITYQPMYLRTGTGQTSASLNNGDLTFDLPDEDEPAESFLYDPATPIESLLTYPFLGPKDHRPAEAFASRRFPQP
jgi:predicted acyl esterase